jgi:predicted NUDIX family NTP pyrophosphohydrolase
MPKKSAGILLYKREAEKLHVFLVHPGGPLWAKKDDGAWSIPKGEYLPGEDPLQSAQREFAEETGSAVTGEFIMLQPIRQPGGKIVHAWAVSGEIDAAQIRSNTFQIEWPPRSGKISEFPEVDRGGWFTLEAARRKILKRQVGFLDQLAALCGMPGAR